MAVAVALLLPAGTWAAAKELDEPRRAAPEIVPGEVIVAVRPGRDPAAVAQALTGRPGRLVPWRPDLVVAFTGHGQEQVGADRFERSDDVRWAAPNVIARTTALPNDPSYRLQWHLHTRTASAGSSAREPSWADNVTGRGVTVAVVDSGVTANEDLDQVLPGFDFVAKDPDAGDEQGHGTHVAGTVAQSTGNGRGAAGVAPDARILPVRVLDTQGAGSYDNILAGIAYAVTNGARIINLSLGGPVDHGMCEAVNSAVTAGSLVVASAGNEAAPVLFPAACPNALAVSAVDRSGALASYSNRGPEIDIAAPGGDVSKDFDGDGTTDGVLQYTFVGGRGGYYLFSGTSMAAPHVSGAAALLLELGPTMTVSQLRSALLTSATDVGPSGPDSSFGAGLLDIAAALPVARAPVATTTTTTTTTSTTARVPTTLAPTTTTTAPPQQRKAVRRFGPSRFGTAAAISKTGFETGAQRVYIASGGSFPDALATGALAGREPGPLLLASSCLLPQETIDELVRLKPLQITIVGGEQAVCSDVAHAATNLTGGAVQRISGSDRYQTAAALSRAGFGSASTVVVASGVNFPDGLSGSALAPRLNAPLLLTAPCSLPEPTVEELRRLRPSRVVVLGGSGAVCDEVLGRIGELTSSGAVSRVSAADRFSTSVAATDVGWPTTAPVVYIATGVNFPDGLAGGPLAARTNGPLLLAPTCDLPASVSRTIERLRPQSVIILGGPSVVCDPILVAVGGDPAHPDAAVVLPA